MKIFLILISASHLLLADTTKIISSGPNAISAIAKENATINIYQGLSNEKIDSIIQKTANKAAVKAAKEAIGTDKELLPGKMLTGQNNNNAEYIIKDTIAIFENSKVNVNKNDSLFKQLTFSIQSGITPNSHIYIDTFVVGKTSRTKRKVDILLLDRFGQIDFQIAFKCLNLCRPIDYNDVAAAIALFNDIGSTISIIVSATPFIESSYNLANANNIKLYILNSTDYAEWKTIFKSPIVFEYIGFIINSYDVALESIKPISHPAVAPIIIDNKSSSNINNLILDAWSHSNHPDTPGIYKNISFIIDTILWGSRSVNKSWFLYYGGNNYLTRSVKANYTLTHEIYLGETELKNLHMLTDVSSTNYDTILSKNPKMSICTRDLLKTCKRINKVPLNIYPRIRCIGTAKTFVEVDSVINQNYRNKIINEYSKKY